MTLDLNPGGRMALAGLLPGPRRADDRSIAVTAVLLAAAFLAAAVGVAVAGAIGAVALAPWMALHLALAGAASVAIAGTMPFFVAALAATPPADVRLRRAAVGLVALGAALVAVRGFAPSVAWAPALGGVTYLAGIGALAVAVRQAGRAGLMLRRPIVTLGYQLALVNVAVGASLGTLAAAGWLPVVERWVALRPAHAWLNLVGFVSLVIVATGLHFVPTVVGARIQPRGAGAIAVLATGGGPLLIGVGMAMGSGPVAGGGAVVAVVGAGALVVETARTVRSRGRWTTDPGWHRVASGGLVAGTAWYLVGLLVAAGLVLARPADGGAWSSPLVAAPLVLGWVIQVLIASWTHLLPSIGPGGPAEHARQRRVLGWVAMPRLVALNAGVALVAIGWPAGSSVVAAGGAGLVGVVVLASVGLAIAAVRVARPR
jgi:hypothetical protein